MKKRINIISIFIMLLTMIGGSFFVGETQKVKAATTCSSSSELNQACTEIIKASGSNEIIGIITISKEGGINFKYKYGMSEIIIVAEKSKDATKIIHVAGTIVDKDVFSQGSYSCSTNELVNKCPSKTVHLYKYFNYDDEVTIRLFYQFAEKSVTDYSDFFKPIYCNVDANSSTCASAKIKDPSAGNLYDNYRKIKTRIDSFVSQIGLTNYVVASYGQTVYAGDFDQIPSMEGYYCKMVNNMYKCDNKAMIYYAPEESIRKINDSLISNRKYHLNEITLTVDNSSMTGEAPSISVLIYDTIIPALLILLSISAGVTFVVLGYQVVKSADEPQERQEKIHRIKSILIGIAIAFIILAAIEPITNLLSNYMGD